VEAQDRASSELERLSSLSEEMDQYGKMKDLMHSAERLESKAARIGRDLESGAPGPEALLQSHPALKRLDGRSALSASFDGDGPLPELN
jgi:hypothetical protein